jgi:hypothetical protein
MQNHEDALEVAKLATAISGQLRMVDNQTTDTTLPANRIDKNKFIQQVVNSVRGNQPNIQPNRNFTNVDEQKMLEYLNREAMMKIPDQSVGGSNIIPPPPMPQGQVSSNMSLNTNQDVLNLIKNIDESLKKLCDFFIENGGKVPKKKKRVIEIKPLPKIGEKIETLTEDDELKLLDEIKKNEEPDDIK